MTYREWVRALLREHRRGRRFGVRCSGCWACDVLPSTTDADRQRCKDLSRGAPGSVDGFDGHHVLPKQVVKREVKLPVWADGGDGVETLVFIDLDDVLFDLRIGVPLRRWHHDQWEARRLSVPRSMLPAGVEQIAEELGLGWWLDRTFGEAGAG